MTPLPIHFAPLQGYTGDVYRRIHHRLMGGISHYYTPFLRMEGSGIRSKDIRDIHPEFNQGVPVIPQIIAKNMKEFDFLTQTVKERGYKHIDINMGCPFPMQAKHGRGSGLLSHVEIIEDMAAAITKDTDLTFSIKMRLGWKNKDEWKPVIDILNQIPLSHITLHPRIGTQQYKGEVCMESFEEFCSRCKHPIIYNGDLTTLEDIQTLQQRFPQLKAIMIGRGLLARPSLAIEYQTGKEMPWETRRNQLLEFHEQLKAHYETTVNSDTQLLNQLRTFWEYMEEELGRKAYKKLMKAGNLKNYLIAVRDI